MSDVEEEIDESLSNQDVLNKYTAATQVANKAIAHVVSSLKVGASVLELCNACDILIREEVKKVLKAQKKIERGLAFPTCISRNNVVGHYSPESDDKEVLEDGDVVKIDVGVQIDGYIGLIAHTHIVGSNNAPTTGRKADAICAAHVAGEAVLRMLKPGAKNKDISNIIKQVADAYHVQPVEGVLSHVMRRYLIDGEKVIMNKPVPDQQAEEWEVETDDVYAIDIVMSTGDGKPKEKEKKPTIYKRAVDQSYMLKLQAARKVLTEVKHKYPALPFTIRNLEEKHARFGLNELEKHGLISSFPILYERNGEFVAQFKFTVLVGNVGGKRMTEHALPYVQSEYNFDDTIKELLSQPVVFNKAVEKKAKKPKTKSTTTTTDSSSSSSSSTPAATPSADAMDTN